MTEPKVPLAKEGYPFIGIAAFIAVIAGIVGYDLLCLLASISVIFITSFFRDPERFTPDLEDGVISPADGKVILIEETYDGRFCEDNVIKVSIFMNVFNVHVNRFPIAGTVKKIIHKPGKFYSADSIKGAEYNEYCSTILETDKGEKLAFVQVAGLIARRIVCWIEKGDKLKAGQKMGLIRFGSRVDLYLPESCRLEISVGDNVVAGETVVGRLAGRVKKE